MKEIMEMTNTPKAMHCNNFVLYLFNPRSLPYWSFCLVCHLDMHFVVVYAQLATRNQYSSHLSSFVLQGVMREKVSTLANKHLYIGKRVTQFPLFRPLVCMYKLAFSVLSHIA